MGKSAGSKLGVRIANTLREIPDESEDFKRLDEITQDLSDDHLDLLLSFLKLFNVLEFQKQREGGLVRAVSSQAKLFLLSLALYLENDLQLISNWDKPGRELEISAENILDYGVQLLSLME